MAENDKPPLRTALSGTLPADCAAVLVYTTFPDLAAAERAGRVLVGQRHAGCINILPGMVSLYIWQEQLERAQEVLLIAKTTSAAAEACMAAVLQLHPCDTPAVLAVPVAAGAAAYLDWIQLGVGPVHGPPA